MRVLLDTHALLWFVGGNRRLSRAARKVIEHEQSELYLSAASVWEMAIKSGLGRLTLPASVGEFVAAKVQAGLRVLAVEWAHAAGVEGLPFHHRDPFDRLLVVQARAEDLPIVTRDRVFRKYGVKTIW